MWPFWFALPIALTPTPDFTPPQPALTQPLAQTAATPEPMIVAEGEPQEFVRAQDVRPLPGQLNVIPVFNSNSPELVLNEGILLSTLDPAGKTTPAAHLNYTFEGYFDLFGHHIAKAEPSDDLRTLHWGVLAHNPSDRSVTIDILQGHSYLSQPDAPFLALDPWIENPTGAVYAGPGSRVMDHFLRSTALLRSTQANPFPTQITVPPQGEAMLLDLGIPVAELDPPINGRSTLMRLRSNGPVQLASMALFAKPGDDGAEIPPSFEEWQALAQTGTLATPRDKVPTPLDASSGAVIYSRVAGVALGSRWQAELTDPDSAELRIPNPGQALSYGISLLHGGTLGTGQVQSGEMVVRYPDTAYQAHGNYGVEYDLTLPLSNPSDQTRTVEIALETPIKENSLSQDGLRFFEPLPKAIFYRGTVRVRYTDDGGLPQTRYVHLVQRRGEVGPALVTLRMPGGDRRLVNVTLRYAPDSTPPQVLTVRTIAP